jgi:Domain of unknown function (DUF4956)
MQNMFQTLLRHGPATCPTRKLGRPTIWRLTGCYIVAFGYILGIDQVAPLAEGPRRVWALWAEGLLFGTATGGHGVPVWVDTLVVMAGAFILTVPIVIVYVRTRTHAVFDESLANTVLVLPAIVTAILIVVRNSLAMAFSLAGIVAAVRFRISLKESRDALYIFAAVAVGFAAGIYRLDVGFVASVVFVLLEVLTWRTDLGADQSSADGIRTHGSKKEKKKDQAKGRPQDMDAPTNATNLVASTLGAATLGPDAREVVLRIQVTNLERGRQAVELLLPELTKSWQPSTRPAGDAGSATLLDYQARLRKRYSAEEVRARLLRGAQAFVVSVEVSPAAQATAPKAIPAGA